MLEAPLNTGNDAQWRLETWESTGMRVMRRLPVLMIVVAAIAAGAYVFVRQRELREQRASGLVASGMAGDAALYSHKVLSVGGLFLTYDSSDTESALWMVRPADLFTALSVQPLVRWKDKGRVVWSRWGRTGADLLIEFAPETNHRFAIVRATCTDRNCRTTSQERGLPPDSRLYVNDDDSVLLLSDTAFTIYSTIAEFMDNKNNATPRLTSRVKGELAATSRGVTLILSSPQTWEGEMIEGKVHTRVRFAMPEGNTPSALAVNGGVQVVADAPGRTELWNCPASVLKGTAACTVYTAPAGFPSASPVSISDDECGIAIGRGDSVWLVRRNAKTQDLLQATGIVRCSAGETVVYKSRRIRYVTPGRQSVTSESRNVSVMTSP